MSKQPTKEQDKKMTEMAMTMALGSGFNMMIGKALQHMAENGYTKVTLTFEKDGKGEGA